MKAVVISEFGGPEVLRIEERPHPELKGSREVMVRVHASALNRADLLQRMGRYPAPNGSAHDIPGLEFSGEVVETAAGVRRWKKGDRVFGICGGGAQAEYLVTDEQMLTRIPERLSWDEAAAVPEAFMTAHDALVTQGGLRSGDRVLITAVASGVGLAAVQIVKALGGRAFGTARTAEKLASAKAFGAESCAVVSDAAELGAAFGDHQFDLVLELVGGGYVAADLAVMAERGRLILVGLMAGAKAELMLGTLLSKRLQIIGTVMRARSLEEKTAVTDAFARDILPLLENGAIVPVVDRVFLMSEIADAHRYMEQNRNTGKIVICMQ